MMMRDTAAMEQSAVSTISLAAPHIIAFLSAQRFPKVVGALCQHQPAIGSMESNATVNESNVILNNDNTIL